MYVYLATDPSNAVFHRRGTIESRAEAEAFANRMARYSMSVYIGADIGNAVSPKDMMVRGMVCVPPTEDPSVLFLQASRPTFERGPQPNGTGFWSRLSGRK